MLQQEDDMSLSGSMVGKLDKAMYGTRDAPQIWQETVEATMLELVFRSSMLHPVVC